MNITVEEEKGIDDKFIGLDGRLYSGENTAKELKSHIALLAEKRVKKANLVSKIALMKLLVERGKKGDMERLINEFTEELVTLMN